MNDERIDELLALAALGELNAAEEAELDLALQDDALLGPELDDAQAAAAELQGLVTEAPPVGQRDAVLGSIAGVAQESAAPQEHDTAGVSRSSGSSNVVSVAAARERRSGRWQLLGAAAAVVAIVVVGAAVVNRGDDAPTFADVVESNDVDARTLDGSLVGELSVFFSLSVEAVALDGTGVANVGADLTYQLWLVDESGATSVGTFVPDGDGSVMATFEGADPTGLTIAVTIEPAGGSEQPTTAIIASA